MIWPFGDGPIGTWLERRRAFKDLGRELSFEAETLSLRDDNPLYRAKVSLQADDPQAARHFLNLARERIPDYVLTCPDTVEILLGLREFAEADALTLRGAKRFPKEPHYLEGYALSAEARRDFAEAVLRWATVRKKFPHRKPGYISASNCLRHLGRVDEAERLVGQVMRIAPGDMGALLEWGRIAEARGDWEEAQRRWHTLRDKHPQGYVGASEALWKLGRIAEAEALLTEARVRFPIYEPIPLMYARIATENGNSAEALKRWAVVRQRFPFQGSGYVSAIQILREQQEWAEADVIAQEAIERFPAHPWPLEEYAALAQFRRDWAEAAKRWAALRAAFPDREYAAQREAEALAKAGLQPVVAAKAAAAQPSGSG